jgi:hypothetical protein
MVISDGISVVPRNRKLLEFRSEPFRGRENNSEFRSMKQKYKITLGIPFRTIPSFGIDSSAWSSKCLGISTFFRGITETVQSLFRGIFSERNSVPNPTYNHLS